MPCLGGHAQDDRRSAVSFDLPADVGLAGQGLRGHGASADTARVERGLGVCEIRLSLGRRARFVAQGEWPVYPCRCLLRGFFLLMM